MSSLSANPFLNEWYECLLAHYQYVLARRDLKTEPTLRQILLKIGFPEDQLAEMCGTYLPMPEALPQLAAPEPTPSEAALETERAPSEAPDELPSAPPTPKKKPPKQLSFF